MDSEVGSVNSNNISNSVNDWEILESVGIDDSLSPSLLVLWVQGWINNLEGADESVAVNLVWESGIDDDSIEVDIDGSGEGSLVKLDILVLNGEMEFRMVDWN